jgi:hypothetical protein
MYPQRGSLEAQLRAGLDGTPSKKNPINAQAHEAAQETLGRWHPVALISRYAAVASVGIGVLFHGMGFKTRGLGIGGED